MTQLAAARVLRYDEAVVRVLLLPVALLMTFVMTPGSAELVENAFHLVQHGDVAHDGSPGHGHTESGDEHGCSGSYHICVCHHTTAFVASAVVGVAALVVFPPVTSHPGLRGEDAPASFDLSDIFRPPIV